MGVVGFGCERAWLPPLEHAAATTASVTAKPLAFHRELRTARQRSECDPRGICGYARRMVTVRVDADLCVGHGRCYVLGPDVFGADEFGHCIVLEEQIADALEAQARMGADNCPEQAITVE